VVTQIDMEDLAVKGRWPGRVLAAPGRMKNQTGDLSPCWSLYYIFQCTWSRMEPFGASDFAV